VYTAGGQVLMGTLRWEKEAADQAQGVLAARARQRQQRELELDLTQTRAQLEVLKQKMTTIGDELQRVSQAEADEESQRVQGAAGVARLRGADARGRRSR